MGKPMATDRGILCERDGCRGTLLGKHPEPWSRRPIHPGTCGDHRDASFIMASISAAQPSEKRNTAQCSNQRLVLEGLPGGKTMENNLLHHRRELLLAVVYARYRIRH